jgi:hypothetical protein
MRSLHQEKCVLTHILDIHAGGKRSLNLKRNIYSKVTPLWCKGLIKKVQRHIDTKLLEIFRDPDVVEEFGNVHNFVFLTMLFNVINITEKQMSMPLYLLYLYLKNVREYRRCNQK